MKKSSLPLEERETIPNIAKIDWLLDKYRIFLEKYFHFRGIAGGFLLGLFVNAMSDSSINHINQVYDRFLDIHSRPFNYLTWFALIIILLFTVSKIFLKNYFGKKSFEINLANIYKDMADISLRPYQRGRITWGSNLTLQSCPDLHQGWLPTEVQIQDDTTHNVLNKELDKEYQSYLLNDFPKKFSYDATRLMLIENPISFSDMKTIKIQVRFTKWSQVQFCNSLFKQNRDLYIGQFLNGEFNLSNTFVLHLVVVTSDNYILITQTSAKVTYSPGKWACSIGEQLDPKDLIGSSEHFANNWVERSLLEELGVQSDGFNQKNVRFMAVYLEADAGNFGLSGIVKTNYDKHTLDSIIATHPRTDYEFQNWEFFTWDTLLNELLFPTKEYHPNTGIRMFYAALFHYGAPGLNRILFNLRKNKR